MIFPKVWHAHYVKIISGYALGFLIPVWIHYGGSNLLSILVEVIIHHYLPFILLIGALYITAGGIQIIIKAHASALINTLVLSLATFVAGWIGTTGAAMLFIRPFLNLNRTRRHRQHLMIFFILLVCNIGGGLTPLGDPPLFLGYLEGIEFSWPLRYMALPMLTLAVPLLIVFYIWDRMRQEDQPIDKKITFDVKGFQNFFYLMVIIDLVLLSGTWKSGTGIHIYGHLWSLENIVRDLGLLLVSYLSYFKTDASPRHANHFHWAPLKEVAVLFAAIFITAYPVLEMLKSPAPSVFTPWLILLNHADGTPSSALYFWATGLLSSFLDNAPTYLVFFNMAGGDPGQMMGPLQNVLLAISAGSVFMGALTYIGNAPNFMVKAIAESDNIEMPSFFGYAGRAALLLLPLLGIMTILFF
ncbi:MAG: sodium:proton antiporter [Janthinobacterium lividum]